MAPIASIVRVMITKGTRTVSLASFNVPAILGPSNRMGSDAYRVYTDPADMLLDGFLASDPEYIHAVALSSQAIKPDKWLVGKFTAAVAQIDTFAVNTVTSGHAYAVTVNGTVVSYTAQVADAEQDILSGLLAAIGAAFPTNPPVTGAVTGLGGSALLTLTSPVAGLGVAYSAIDAKLTKAVVAANHSITEDLQALQLALVPDVSFYGVLITSKASSDILQMAKYIETQLLVYLSGSSEAGILTTSTTDIASVLKGLNYSRTALLFTATVNTEAGDAAWMGYMLTTTPGIGNWALKSLVGVTADKLTDTQITNAQSKNCNTYVTIGGAGTTYKGVCASGAYIDEVIFDDWLASTMQTNVFAILTDPNNLKVSYTNKGIVAIENGMRQALQQGEDNQGIIPGWTISAPDANTVPSADKKSRTLNGMSFNAVRAGAIDKVNIQGFMSV
jgi:hypothetical protein